MKIPIIKLSILFLVVASALAIFKMPFPEPFDSLRLGILLLLFVTIFWFFKILVQKEAKIIHTKALYPLYGLFIVSIFSLGYSWFIGIGPSKEFGLGQILLIFFPIITVLAVINNIKTIRWIKIIFLSALLTSLVVSSIGILNHIIEGGPLWITNRLESTISGSALGIYLMIFFPLALAQLIYASSISKKIFYISILSILGFALYATFIRSAWVGIVFSILMILILRFKKSIPLKTMMTSLILVIVIIVSFPFWVPYVLNVIQVFDPDIEGYYVLARIPGWLDGWRIFTENWWLGVGAGNLVPFIKVFEYNPEIGVRLPVIHNNYLEIAATMGIMGLVFLIWLLISVLIKSFQVFEVTQDQFLKGIALGFLGAFIGFVPAMLAGDFLIHSVWNAGFYSFCATIYIWILLGLVIAIDRLKS